MSELLAAVYRGDQARVDELLAEKPTLDIFEVDGATGATDFGPIAAAIENGSGGGVPASQFMTAGTIIATPVAQISRPTTNSTGRRSSMRTHQR